MVTVSDFFCGAGGSSTGLQQAGFEVKIAVNHWALAIETHNTNHQDTDHYLDDIQATPASRYPRTDVLWMSPECTNHSVAKGKKRTNLGQLDLWGEHKIDPAEERSRATMREVVEFTTHHRYEYVIVENVVDIRKWMHYDTWWSAMMNLGYEGRVLYLNAQFFGVPQSRDRYYAVFWKKGNRAPNLDFRPAAWCPRCEAQVASLQVFKKHPQWGRYGAKRQYTYRCPQCAQDVEPYAPPAASVIDWNNLGTVIGDRKRPLKPKTMERIKTGLKKFARPWVMETGGVWERADRPVDQPLSSLMTRETMSLVNPFVVDTMFTHSNTDRTTSLEKPLPTQTSRQSHGITIPPFTVETLFTHSDIAPVSSEDPLPTQTTYQSRGIAIPPFLMSYYGRQDAQSGLDASLPVIPTEPRHSLIVPPMIMSYMNNATEPRSVNEPLYTIAGGHNSPLVVPPFLTGFYSSGPSATSADDPIPTIMGVPHHGLVSFLTSYYGNEQSSPVGEPMRTVTGNHRHAMVSVNLTEKDLEDMLMASRFRMLTPLELKRGMSFPEEYVILGNEREQVKQTGNAVCCLVAQWIGERVIEAMGA